MLFSRKVDQPLDSPLLRSSLKMSLLAFGAFFDLWDFVLSCFFSSLRCLFSILRALSSGEFLCVWATSIAGPSGSPKSFVFPAASCVGDNASRTDSCLGDCDGDTSSSAVLFFKMCLRRWAVPYCSEDSSNVMCVFGLPALARRLPFYLCC